MKPGRAAIGILTLIAMLTLINAILGNIVANVLQEWLGPNARLVVFPFLLIAAILVGFELRDRLQGSAEERPRAGLSGQNRARMLAKMRKIWLTDFLDRSLYRELLITLDLVEQPALVLRPMDLLVQRPDCEPRPLPAGTAIAQVYDELDQELLILGAPGAGKTTMLLELARELLDRAAQDSEQPIPIVFPLASWAETRRPLVDWLVDELNKRYDVPRAIAQACVTHDQVLPLLDGLDEVAADQSEGCVAAINTYRQQHGLLPIVVCSRIADYEALRGRLRLGGAIVVQPLTRWQITSYLHQLGPALAGLRATLHKDKSLWELLETPLLLSIVTLVYQGRASAEVPSSGTLSERRTHLFAAYVQRMLERRSADPHYPSARTLHYLAWLARGMVEHSQTVFYIEQLQPDWLPRRQRWAPTWGIAALVGLVFGLVVVLVFGLVFGLVVGLVFGLLTYEHEIASVEALRWSWADALSAVRNDWRSMLVLGLVGGLVGGLVVGLYIGLVGGLNYGGGACLQHLVLRLLIYRNGTAPWNYARFLDSCADRILLRKIGGGYIFIHRMLMDYFAALEPDDEAKT